MQIRKSKTVRAVWIPINIDFDDFTSLFTPSVAFVSIEKIYQALETVFHRLSKHLEFHHSAKILRCASYFQLS